MQLRNPPLGSAGAKDNDLLEPPWMKGESMNLPDIGVDLCFHRHGCLAKLDLSWVKHRCSHGMSKMVDWLVRCGQSYQEELNFTMLVFKFASSIVRIVLVQCGFLFEMVGHVLQAPPSQIASAICCCALRPNQRNLRRQVVEPNLWRMIIGNVFWHYEPPRIDPRQSMYGT